MKQYKAVIFDLDGTLLDTLTDLANSMNQVLEEASLPIHPVDAYRFFVGDGAATLITRAIPEDLRTPENIQAYLASFLEVYKRSWDKTTRPYDGILEMLAALAGKGIKIAVLSNKPDEFTKLCVARYFPKIRFHMIYGQRDSFPRKPDPAGALDIAEKIGISPAEIIYLGDTSIDMKTAAAAGMYAIGALWGFRSCEELVENGASVLIGNPMGLLDLMQ